MHANRSRQQQPQQPARKAVMVLRSSEGAKPSKLLHHNCGDICGRKLAAAVSATPLAAATPHVLEHASYLGHFNGVIAAREVSCSFCCCCTLIRLPSLGSSLIGSANGWKHAPAAATAAAVFVPSATAGASAAATATAIPTGAASAPSIYARAAASTGTAETAAAA